MDMTKLQMLAITVVQTSILLWLAGLNEFRDLELLDAPSVPPWLRFFYLFRICV